MAVLSWGSGPSLGLIAACGIALCLLVQHVSTAPVYEQQSTDLESYDSENGGCYYNFQHYSEGDRIITNEPCLNCTCHNRMLMCYLRVCPFTKAIGQDCKIEKRPEQCCPVISCPEVPVQLLTSTTTVSPSTDSTAVGHVDHYGCTINELFYSDGARVPSDANTPCELCYCIRNKTACVMQECTLNVKGCKPVYQDGVCCPVRYDCDQEDTLLLETTVNPEPPMLYLPTTLSPTATCNHNGEIYADGALITSEKPCEHLYCMRGEIVGAVQECGTPLENHGKNCTALPPREGQCCPDVYECDNVTLTAHDLEITAPSSEEPTTEGSEMPSDDQQPHQTDEAFPAHQDQDQTVEQLELEHVSKAEDGSTSDDENAIQHVTTEEYQIPEVPAEIDPESDSPERHHIPGHTEEPDTEVTEGHEIETNEDADITHRIHLEESVESSTSIPEVTTKGSTPEDIKHTGDANEISTHPTVDDAPSTEQSAHSEESSPPVSEIETNEIPSEAHTVVTDYPPKVHAETTTSEHAGEISTEASSAEPLESEVTQSHEEPIAEEETTDKRALVDAHSTDSHDELTGEPTEQSTTEEIYHKPHPESALPESDSHVTDAPVHNDEEQTQEVIDTEHSSNENEIPEHTDEITHTTGDSTPSWTGTSENDQTQEHSSEPTISAEHENPETPEETTDGVPLDGTSHADDVHHHEASSGSTTESSQETPDQDTPASEVSETTADTQQVHHDGTAPVVAEENDSDIQAPVTDATAVVDDEAATPAQEHTSEDSYVFVHGTEEPEIEHGSSETTDGDVVSDHTSEHTDKPAQEEDTPESHTETGVTEDSDHKTPEPHVTEKVHPPETEQPEVSSETGLPKDDTTGDEDQEPAGTDKPEPWTVAKQETDSEMATTQGYLDEKHHSTETDYETTKGDSSSTEETPVQSHTDVSEQPDDDLTTAGVTEMHPIESHSEVTDSSPPAEPEENEPHHKPSEENEIDLPHEYTDVTAPTESEITDHKSHEVEEQTESTQYNELTEPTVHHPEDHNLSSESTAEVSETPTPDEHTQTPHYEEDEHTSHIPHESEPVSTAPVEQHDDEQQQPEEEQSQVTEQIRDLTEGTEETPVDDEHEAHQHTEVTEEVHDLSQGTEGTPIPDAHEAEHHTDDDQSHVTEKIHDLSQATEETPAPEEHEVEDHKEDQQTHVTEQTHDLSQGTEETPIPDEHEVEHHTESEQSEVTDQVHDVSHGTEETPITGEHEGHGHTDDEQSEVTEKVHDYSQVTEENPITHKHEVEHYTESEQSQVTEKIHDLSQVTEENPITDEHDAEHHTESEQSQVTEKIYDPSQETEETPNAQEHELEHHTEGEESQVTEKVSELSQGTEETPLTNEHEEQPQIDDAESQVTEKIQDPSHATEETPIPEEHTAQHHPDNEQQHVTEIHDASHGTEETPITDENIVQEHEQPHGITEKVHDLSEGTEPTIQQFTEDDQSRVTEKIHDLSQETEETPITDEHAVPEDTHDDESVTTVNISDTEEPSKPFESHTDLSKIPGEGECLVDGVTFANNAEIPVTNHCQTSCHCANSIIHCRLVECTPPPPHMMNCVPVFHDVNSCCPTYNCESAGSNSLEADSQMKEHSSDIPSTTSEFYQSGHTEETPENVPDLVTESHHDTIEDTSSELPTEPISGEEDTDESVPKHDATTTTTEKIHSQEDTDESVPKHDATTTTTEKIHSQEHTDDDETKHSETSEPSVSEASELPTSDSEETTHGSDDNESPENVEHSENIHHEHTTVGSDVNEVTHGSEHDHPMEETTEQNIPTEDAHKAITSDNEPEEASVSVTEETVTHPTSIQENFETSHPQETTTDHHIHSETPSNVHQDDDLPDHTVQPPLVHESTTTDLDNDVKTHAVDEASSETPVDTETSSLPEDNDDTDKINEAVPSTSQTHEETPYPEESSSATPKQDAHHPEHFTTATNEDSETQTVTPDDQQSPISHHDDETSEATSNYEKTTEQVKIDDADHSTETAPVISEDHAHSSNTIRPEDDQNHEIHKGTYEPKDVTTTESVTPEEPDHLQEHENEIPKTPELHLTEKTPVDESNEISETPVENTDEVKVTVHDEPETTTRDGEIEQHHEQTLNPDLDEPHGTTEQDVHHSDDHHEQNQEEESGLEHVTTEDSWQHASSTDNNILVPDHDEGHTPVTESEAVVAENDIHEPISTLEHHEITSESAPQEENTEKDVYQHTGDEYVPEHEEHQTESGVEYTTKFAPITDTETKTDEPELHTASHEYSTVGTTDHSPEPEKEDGGDIHNDSDNGSEQPEENSVVEDGDDNSMHTTEINVHHDDVPEHETPLSTDDSAEDSASHKNHDLTTAGYEPEKEDHSSEHSEEPEAHPAVTENNIGEEHSEGTTQEVPHTPTHEVPTHTEAVIDEEEGENDSSPVPHVPVAEITTGSYEHPTSSEAIHPEVTESHKPEPSDVTPVEEHTEDSKDLTTAPALEGHVSTTESHTVNPNHVQVPVEEDHSDLSTSSPIHELTTENLHEFLSTHNSLNVTSSIPDEIYQETLPPHRPVESDFHESQHTDNYGHTTGHSPSGYPGHEDGDNEDTDDGDQATFGPGTCRYGGKVYVSAQQIPRDDPCDFCFCFRSDIICLQQSCPPPIPGCHEEPIHGFCCPRYECPVSMATVLNVTTTTTTTTTTLPPHFLQHAYKGAASQRGCQIQGHAYQVGEVVRSKSGPCLQCTCGGDGQMKCNPKICSPQPMIQQMMAAAAASSSR